jgi:hypothetical protein
VSEIVELSGEHWCRRFPGSSSTATLVRPFRRGVQRFIGALERAGARVSIASTYRPPERAYLMHWAWKLAHGEVQPADVPDHPGVPIEWDHGDPVRSRSAALDMVDGYRMAYGAALASRHTEGLAVDMRIAIERPLALVDADGVTHGVEVDPTPHDNPAIIAVGATYGVHRLRSEGHRSDPPHWSSDGR